MGNPEKRRARAKAKRWATNLHRGGVYDASTLHGGGGSATRNSKGKSKGKD